MGYRSYSEPLMDITCDLQKEKKNQAMIIEPDNYTCTLRPGN
uniref:Uncharacterized protein n=1 Tax=Anguilla anguilla TaxID=7936 RepID=A0A0E9W030_ANGAN